MELLYQTHSPFARKVLVFAHEAGLSGTLEVVHHETSPIQRNAEVFAFNPLGKVPVLLRPDAPALFDSDVICQYLDGLAARSLYPADPEERFAALRRQALAQGLAEAGIAYRWETVRRPENLRYPRLAEGHAAKLSAAYDWLETNGDFNRPLDIGHIALATTLDWLCFRALPDFRPGRPKLASWFASFLTRPSMQATPLAGETQD